MLEKLKLKILLMRYGLKLYNASRDVNNELSKTWVFVRHYPQWLSDIYLRLSLFADKKGIKRPKVKIKMNIEGVIESGKN
jgi:hypothetical protein